MSLTAKMVWEIMERRFPWVMERLVPSLTEGSSGKSSSLLPMISKEVGPHWIWTEQFSVPMDTTSSGIRRSISPNSRADSTMAPSSVISAGAVVTMPVSRL